MQGILLRVHHYESHIDDAAHEQIRTHRIMTAIEIGGYTALEAFCLSHIDDFSPLVDIHVHARRVRESKNLPAQLFAGSVVAKVFRSPVGGNFYPESSGFINYAAESLQDLPDLFVMCAVRVLHMI